MDGDLDLLIGAAWTQLGDTLNAGAVSVWYGPIAGNLSSDAADAQIVGDGAQSGRFGYATAVTPDGTLAIGAPMMEFGDDEAVVIEGVFGGSFEVGASDGLGWGDKSTWGDGAVYVLHAGY